MPIVGELKAEDFKNTNLADDCSRFAVLLAVVERASSLYDEAKNKKGKDSNCNSSFLKRKICSAEKNSASFGVTRKDDVFGFQTVSSSSGAPKKNRPDLKVVFPIKKRPPLPIEDDTTSTADGINNYEDSKPNSSFLKRKICSTEKNSASFGVTRKDDVFCFQTVLSSGAPKKNRPHSKVILPIKKRPPLPIEDDSSTGTADGINNYEGISKKRRRKNQMDLGMIDYFNPIDEILLLHQRPFDHHLLPIEFKESIKSLNQGLTIEKEILVIQKALTATDISPHQNRFSIPLNQILNSSFLNDDEIKILESREENGKKVKKLEINLIDPMQKEWSVRLARWVMNKPDKTKGGAVAGGGGGGGGGVSISYVINGPWAKIVDSNKLKEGDVMQLWGVRVEGSLWFVLVKLQN